MHDIMHNLGSLAIRMWPLVSFVSPIEDILGIIRYKPPRFTPEAVRYLFSKGP